MRRLAKSVPPAELTPRTAEERITETRAYTLITPLYGGGVKPFEYDPITVVRATEIRGLLRFWWRACRGGNATGNLAEMKEREDMIWGKAYKKGEQGILTEKIVTVSVEKNNTTIIPEKNSKILLEYASFPLRPTEQQKKADPTIKEKPVYSNVSFKLTISFPQDLDTDIRAALWAWETFGGVGARTRRGFGALHLESIDGRPNSDLPLEGDVKNWINKKMEKYVLPATWSDNIPHLSRQMNTHIITVSTNSIEGENKRTPSEEAWNYLISKLASFRQGPFGRSGRSRWPEAETIRKITTKRHKYTLKHHPEKFPRAAFGLPINFQFKDSEENGVEDEPDPQKTLLKVADKMIDGVKEKRDRFASPLILKPLRCQNDLAVGLAVVLEGTHLPSEKIALKDLDNDEDEKEELVDHQLTIEDLDKLPDLKLRQTDILQVFMNYLRRRNRQ